MLVRSSIVKYLIYGCVQTTHYFTLLLVCPRKAYQEKHFIRWTITIAGGFKYFLMFTTYLEKWSNLTSIFFRCVGSTTIYTWIPSRERSHIPPKMAFWRWVFPFPVWWDMLIPWRVIRMISNRCFLKWWYPQNTSKWSCLIGKPMVVGYHHFRKPPSRWTIRMISNDGLTLYLVPWRRGDDTARLKFLTPGVWLSEPSWWRLYYHFIIHGTGIFTYTNYQILPIKTTKCR